MIFNLDLLLIFESPYQPRQWKLMFTSFNFTHNAFQMHASHLVSSFRDRMFETLFNQNSSESFCFSNGFPHGFPTPFTLFDFWESFFKAFYPTSWQKCCANLPRLFVLEHQQECWIQIVTCWILHNRAFYWKCFLLTLSSIVHAMYLYEFKFPPKTFWSEIYYAIK